MVSRLDDCLAGMIAVIGGSPDAPHSLSGALAVRHFAQGIDSSNLPRPDVVLDNRDEADETLEEAGRIFAPIVKAKEHKDSITGRLCS